MKQKYVTVLLIFILISAIARLTNQYFHYKHIQSLREEMSFSGIVNSGDLDLLKRRLASTAAGSKDIKLDDSPMVWAIYFKYREMVNYMLSEGVAPYSFELHNATFYRRFEYLEDLIKYGAKVDGLDLFGFTPLMWAAKLNLVPEAKLYISHGANVNARFVNGQTPLIYVTGYSSHEFVELLLEKGADPSIPYEPFGSTALHDAVSSSDLKTVSLLLKSPLAKIDLKNKLGYTPLMIAIKNNRPDVVEELLRAGASVNVTDYYMNTPLQLAVDLGRNQIINALLQAGASKEKKNKFGLNSCDSAKRISEDHVKNEVVALLKCL